CTAHSRRAPARARPHLPRRRAAAPPSFGSPPPAASPALPPTRRNVMWLTPWEPGTYLGQCAEYCGTQHAHMLLRVVAHPAEEFQRWVASQRQPAVVDPRVASGRQLFEATACVNCHTVHGTDASGTFGPDLTHLMSRETLGAGVAPNDPATLTAWVADPNVLKPGVLMPAMQLSKPELDQVVAYLTTLR